MRNAANWVLSGYGDITFVTDTIKYPKLHINFSNWIIVVSLRGVLGVVVAAHHSSPEHSHESVGITDHLLFSWLIYDADYVFIIYDVDIKKDKLSW